LFLGDFGKFLIATILHYFIKSDSKSGKKLSAETFKCNCVAKILKSNIVATTAVLYSLFM